MWAQIGTITIALIGAVVSVFALMKERKQESEQLGVTQLDLALKTQQAQLDRQDQQIMAKDAKIDAQSSKIDRLQNEVGALRTEVHQCHREKNDMGVRLDYLQGELERLKADGTQS